MLLGCNQDGSESAVGWVCQGAAVSLCRPLQEMDIRSLTGYRQSIMSLCDGGRLYRKELELVLCNDSAPFK